VERIVISRAAAVVFGRFEHTAASTGRSFETRVALHLAVSAGKGAKLHLYEDTTDLLEMGPLPIPAVQCLRARPAHFGVSQSPLSEERTQKHRRAGVFAVQPKPRRSSASTHVPLSRYAHSRSATYLTVLPDVPVRIPYEATPIATATHTSWGSVPQ
jgi:hypothetical protein